MQFQDRLWGELAAHVSGAMNLLRDLFLGLEDSPSYVLKDFHLITASTDGLMLSREAIIVFASMHSSLDYSSAIKILNFIICLNLVSFYFGLNSASLSFSEDFAQISPGRRSSQCDP
jgi:hypothetical protein